MLGTLTLAMLYPHISLPIAGIDKLAHWSAFFLLGLALLGPLAFPKTEMILILLVLSFGLEGAQTFIAERQAGIADLMANLLGVCCAFLLVQLATLMQRVKPSK